MADAENKPAHVCTRFAAHQMCRHDVIVDANNSVIEDVGIADAQSPYGPYECTECGEISVVLPCHAS